MIDRIYETTITGFGLNIWSYDTKSDETIPLKRCKRLSVILLSALYGAYIERISIQSRWINQNSKRNACVLWYWDNNTGDEGVTYYKELEDTEEEIESEILDQ